MTDTAAATVLLERVRREERASLGMDPDGTAYLDIAERIEVARAAYRASIEQDGGEPEIRRAQGEERRPTSDGAPAELL